MEELERSNLKIGSETSSELTPKTALLLWSPVPFFRVYGSGWTAQLAYLCV